MIICRFISASGFCTVLLSMFITMLPVRDVAAAASTATATTTACPSLLDHSFADLNDETSRSLCKYAGKVVLVVNTASFCGYTNQYEGLERLYAKYRERGLVVVGFPSNDFGNQEPGTNAQIADFCRTTYGVKFPMVARTEVSGSKANPFYQQLAAMTGQRPQWNSHKYLIDRSGKSVISFPSRLEPESPELITAIERLLNVAARL